MGCSYSHPCGHTRSLKPNGCRTCGELNADMHITCHEATRRRIRRSWCMTNSKVLVQLLCDDYNDHRPQDACTSLIRRPSKSWHQTRKHVHEPQGLILDTKVTEIDPGFSTWFKNASSKSHKQVKMNLEAACSHYIPYSPRTGLAGCCCVDLNPL